MAGAAEFSELRMSTNEYYKRDCWTTTECEEPFVADVVCWFGDDHIDFESDFPHPDSKYPKATQTFLDLMPEEISDESKRKILWDIAIDTYRLPNACLPGTFEEATVVG